ncbi:hypothetical protein [Picrophilus oshimae]|uniref:Uncharacterized protein n=1 Tax=Picrophilus torridus (strain ATCC 700027 / DSM 9790 / JCM 10055 / NBRC 100828 / KAW 2/3) TaxID=1122961 RepID=A0A8G2L7V7_PICTO|nr:hypothetical protein [Picrophilus oshimae]SMD30705.1 hypothetical protein SAMN02745355_0599 [Picrophilus oshimae DSM 9789]
MNTKNRHNNQKRRYTKKLDMRKNAEFNYMLGTIVRDLPDSVRGAIRGGIYSIASKKGIFEAKDFIIKQREAGIIDENTEKKLIDLIFDYSKYRQ